MQSNAISHFQDTVLEHYNKYARHDMEWRKHPTAYNVVVSEVMLQQTQVERVKPKFASFVKALPSFQALAQTDTKTLLSLWQGLGYNRRALNLQKTAQVIQQKYGGELPKHIDELVTLPAIGPATAGAIVAYAYNLPVVFIETNIRRAVIHHFFTDIDGVHDKDIYPILQTCIKNLDQNVTPREWYWAITDYGHRLKTITTNPNRKSKHYSKQSTFAGSARELRGKIVAHLISTNTSSSVELLKLAQSELQKEQFNTIVQGLEKEQFLVKTENGYRLV